MAPIPSLSSTRRASRSYDDEDTPEETILIAFQEQLVNSEELQDIQRPTPEELAFIRNMGARLFHPVAAQAIMQNIDDINPFGQPDTMSMTLYSTAALSFVANKKNEPKVIRVLRETRSEWRQRKAGQQKSLKKAAKFINGPNLPPPREEKDDRCVSRDAAVNRARCRAGRFGHVFKLERMKAKDIDFVDQQYVATSTGPGINKGYYCYFRFALEEYVSVYVFISKGQTGMTKVKADEIENYILVYPEGAGYNLPKGYKGEHPLFTRNAPECKGAMLYLGEYQVRYDEWIAIDEGTFTEESTVRLHDLTLANKVVKKHIGQCLVASGMSNDLIAEVRRAGIPGPSQRFDVRGTTVKKLAALGANTPPMLANPASKDSTMKAAEASNSGPDATAGATQHHPLGANPRTAFEGVPSFGQELLSLGAAGKQPAAQAALPQASSRNKAPPPQQRANSGGAPGGGKEKAGRGRRGTNNPKKFAAQSFGQELADAEADDLAATIARMKRENAREEDSGTKRFRESNGADLYDDETVMDDQVPKRRKVDVPGLASVASGRTMPREPLPEEVLKQMNQHNLRKSEAMQMSEGGEVKDGGVKEDGED
ncbi:hypothetical protein LTR36_008931 [Oleoguttula mirabilis]|uniref:Uncharacterized protein n=1 Tax=Oleoguttula mirabilis TaxID=1507867 RepID=A0AAV9J6P5_9PEZI|nr:hypothetical protein LTR36_008931 [Oleoguttula mirabilis]